MSQLSVTLQNNKLVNNNCYSIHIDDFQLSTTVTRYTNSEYDILIWGDVSYKNVDKTIILDLLSNNFISYCGISWIIINRISKSIHCAADKYGSFPVLLYKDRKHTLLANSRTALHTSLKTPLQFNKSAMREIISLGQLFDTSSIIENTTHIIGSTLCSLEVNSAKHTIKKTINRLVSNNPSHSYKDAKEALIESVRNCLKADNNTLISLSGGQDSRTILAVCDLLNLKPDALCYCVANSTYVSYAKALANACGLTLFHPTSCKTNLSHSTIERISKASMDEVPFIMLMPSLMKK